VTLGIRGKLLFTIGSTLLIVLSIHTYWQLNLQQAAFESELLKRTELLKENLHQRALSQSESLNHMTIEDIASYNLFSLANKMQQATLATDELAYIILLDNQNKIHVHTSQPERQQSIYTKPKHGLRKLEPTHQTNTESEWLEYTLPVDIGETRWGQMILGYSLLKLNAQITQSQQDNEAKQRALTLKTAAASMTILLIAYFLISQFSKRLIAPIIKLSAFAKEIAAGNFSPAHQDTSLQNDELGELTRSFSDMALRLEGSYQKLAEYNQTLEEKVNRRTLALNLKNDELSQALTDLEES